MLELAADLWASRRTVLRGVLRPLLLLLRVKPPVGALLLLQAYQLLRHKGQTLTPTPTPNPNQERRQGQEGGEAVGEVEGEEGGKAADARAQWAMLATLLRLSSTVAATLGQG